MYESVSSKFDLMIETTELYTLMPESLTGILINGQMGSMKRNESFFFEEEEEEDTVVCA